MSRSKILVSFMALSLLAGCSHFSQGNRIAAPSYDNKNGSPVKVPPGMAISFNTLYPIPARTYPSNPRPVDITPPSLDVSPNAGSGWFSWY